MLTSKVGSIFRRSIQSRCLATAAAGESSNIYQMGEKLHGYTIKEVQKVPEFSLTAVRLEHQRTGSEHLHLDAPADKNNVFSVALKTNPLDAKGTPHILEHITLCGSRKYPVNDPFFKMLNRSLNNFMNAMTGHDYTFYPFATTNKTDFYNLMDVYLSLVFDPLLNHQDFLQEAWRMEQSDMTDKASPMEYKGVVFNEMKGQYSNSAYLFWIKFQEAIYGSLNNSGGDPSKILDLKFQELQAFHKQNYNPSYGRTFTYGNLPLEAHLKKLDDFFADFGRSKSNGHREVKKPIFELDKSKQFDVEVPGVVDPMTTKPIEEQLKSSITWYLGNPLDESMRYDVFKWRILSTLLLDGHNAPFYQELIETGFGEDFSPNTGFDSMTAMMSFTLGLSNLSKEKVKELGPKIRNILIDRVIPELARGKESSYHERVEAMIHQIELGFKKHKPDFGVGLLSSLVPSWTNGANPINALKIDHILNTFKKDYEENGLKIFSNIIEKTILNEDSPQFRFTMIPDENFNQRLTQEEKKRLSSEEKKLDDNSRESIHKRGEDLLEKQKKSDSGVEVLPSLTVDDIPRKGDFHEITFSQLAGGNGKIQKRITNTNDLVYVTATKDLSYLPVELYKYLPLFNSCLTNLAGTSQLSILELENKIQRYTGGVTFTTFAKADPFNINKLNFKYSMSGMALKENTGHLYEIWEDVLSNTKLDGNDKEVVEKLNVLIKNLGQNQLNNISDRGHVFANSYSNAQLTPTKYVNDLFGGIEQVKFISELNKRLDTEGKEYLSREIMPILKKIQQYLLHKHTEDGISGFNYNIVSDAASVAENEKLIEKFDEKLVSNESVSQRNVLQDLTAGFSPANGSNTVLKLPLQVSYASLAHLGAAFTSKDGAALQVLSQILTFKHLHSVIRESNGAYGGGLSYDGLGGTLNFYSYRDPHGLKSVKSFTEAASIAKDNLANAKWGDKDLQEAKLAIFQSVDAPSHISSQGSDLFLEGITDEMKQERRERFLDVGLSDLQDVNEKYLLKPDISIKTVIGDVEAPSQEWKSVSF
ncbi:uncharacterized protein CXQ87_002849 [Candidozyma duobushaemuli]|uniref:Presequence protease, mitochondrial n=2 Tax=Candidozyma TaxID=3303203 RepID=A0ABX8I3Y3_9ASCO|nr:uncharacterized protein CXQ87_002849 [[Candida] duobushaemulonis]PVH14702.1 hypothetical protein CXQ87_002849 [[Candida] duobushaemulonis]QWU87158.1 hypothetical protein CA3LBN_001423 [[Candida] haemuloni]